MRSMATIASASPPGARLLLCVLLATVGCQPVRPGEEEDDPGGGTDGGNEPAGVLTVTPASSEITINNAMDQTISLRATSKQYGDVTKSAIWSVSDAGAGGVNGGQATFFGTAERGGSYKISASYKNQAGYAVVNVRVNLGDVLHPSAPADAKDYFSGAMGGAAPSVAYPFDNTMMAPNVLQLQAQWSSAGHQVFRIEFKGPTYQRTHYVGASLCPSSKCTYLVDDKVWSGMSHSALSQDVTMTVYGSSSKGGNIGASQPVKISFSPEDIKGGLYYFSPTIRGIKKVPLGASKPVDFIINGAETGCAGCHAVTRDGKQVAIEFGSGQTRTGSTVVDGGMPTKRSFALQPSIAWNFSWFSPMGDKLLTNWSGTLKVRDPKNGQVLSTVSNDQMGSQYGGAMPEWSPDGKWIAFVRILQSSAYDFELSNSGDIAIMPYNNGAFGPAVTLVKGQPNNEVHIWPSWTPDSKWLVFNSHTCGGATCNQYNAQRTRLRLVRAIDDAGQPASEAPVELLQGTHIKDNVNNWPKVAPFLQAGRLVFVVYSANYGWGHKGGGLPQLYMFGLDLSKAKTGDPSYQPVWLPFQEPNTGNHSAIWTTDVACVKNSDCPAEFECSMGSCVPRIG